MFKKPETVIGTGPWMLERYEPNVRLPFVRNPNYYQPGAALRGRDRGRASTRTRPRSSRPGSRPVRLRAGDPHDDAADGPRRRQAPQAEPADGGVHLADLHARRAEARGGRPSSDVRVRRALHMAVNGKEVIEVNPMGLRPRRGQPDRAAALREWAIPIDQLPPRAASSTRQIPAEAKRLLAQAGHERAQVPRGVDGQLGPRLLRRRAGHPRPVEEGRHRDRAQAQGRVTPSSPAARPASSRR